MPDNARNAGELQALIDDEKFLVRCVAGGDRAAFEKLYRLYYRRLVRFLRRMLSRSHDAEEVLNETMLVVWSKAAKFKATGKVSTWIFGIAYRLALRSLRRSRGVFEPITDDTAVSDSDVTEEAVTHINLSSRLEQVMLRLSPEQRAVIELTYFCDYSYTEISEILDCPTGTVKARMLHARRKLQRHLGSDWGQ